jgi:hypothetical protein
LARHELRAAYSAMVRPAGSEASPAMPVEAFAGLALSAFRSARATACRSRQAWRLLARLARRAMGEAAGRLATHELRAAWSATVRLEDSEQRPAMPVGAFVGLAPPVFRSAPAMACHSRQAMPGRAANGLTAMLPADLGAPLARVGRGLFPEDSVGDLRSLSPSWPRMAAGRLSRRSPPPPRQLQHLPPSADPTLDRGSANPD